MSQTIFPSLLRSARPPAGGAGPVVVSSAADARSLLDLMFDGFYLVFLLRRGAAPQDADVFRARVKEFLAQVDQGAKRLGADPDDVHDAKFAYCALTDELILAEPGPVADAWVKLPLQLELFGEQLAGETFFDRLEALRARGAAKLQPLEVFHMCLLCGFRGRYVFEGLEKLSYLTARLGDEIAGHKGRAARGAPVFAPQALAPDRIAHKLRHEVPLWVVASVVALGALIAFVGLRWALERHTRATLEPYARVIELPTRQAFVSITLP